MLMVGGITGWENWNITRSTFDFDWAATPGREEQIDLSPISIWTIIKIHVIKF